MYTHRNRCYPHCNRAGSGNTNALASPIDVTGGRPMVSPELLRRFPFFAGLTDEEIKSIAMISEERKYDANTFVFREGNKAEKLFILIEGTIDIKINTDE